MQLSKQGLMEICSYEGVCLAPYLDDQGVWTIGIGHTHFDSGLNPSKMKPSDKITLQQAIDMFKVDMKTYEATVNKVIKVVLLQPQFDALVSFDYNTGGLSNSTLARYINNKESLVDIGKEFMRWHKPTSIIRRRTNEKNLFLNGTYTNNGTMLEMFTDGKGNQISKGMKDVPITSYF